jgi:hypothetical protein
VRLNVTVADSASPSLETSQEFIITIINRNEAPTEIVLDHDQLEENALGAALGILTATDPDHGDVITFSVDDARFEVAGGSLQLTQGQSIDFESEPNVTLTVTAIDSGAPSLGISQAFVITIIDRNEAPTEIALDHHELEENAQGGTVGRLAAADQDEGDVLTFSVDDPRFEITGGILKLKDGQSIDFETESSVTLTVTAADSGSPSLEASQEFTVAVIDVLEVTHPWQNPADPHDVDRDNRVTLQDLVKIVQMLRELDFPYDLPMEFSPGETPPAYIDVDGDDTATLNDLLVLVQWLRNDLLS